MLSTKLIGNRITEARKKVTLSQAQLAEKLFISSQAVGKWERGESLPDLITLSRLAELLNVDLNYFAGAESVNPTVAESQSAETVIDEIPGKKKKLNWDMSQGNWIDADFSGLNGLNEKFSSSNMQRCLFRGSDLSGLLLSGNNITECDFSSSDINGSTIRRSNLEKINFSSCSLRETEFTGSNVSSSDFSGADLSDMKFKSGAFGKNVVVHAILNRTLFQSSHLSDIVFEGKLEDCYFEGCNFKRVEFKEAVLINSFFKNNDLRKVKFVNCKADKITYEFLKHGKADLSGVELTD